MRAATIDIRIAVDVADDGTINVIVPATIEDPSSETVPETAGEDAELPTPAPDKVGSLLDEMTLNSGEITMLGMIAEASPEVCEYDDLREALGTGRKFGNVSSGLRRRFKVRGYDRPYKPDADNIGYVMPKATADVVLKAIGTA